MRLYSSPDSGASETRNWVTGEENGHTRAIQRGRRRLAEAGM